jgi:hypothetical protein
MMAQKESKKRPITDCCLIHAALGEETPKKAGRLDGLPV